MGQKLGQHFLHDEQILQRIVEAIFSLVEKNDIQTLREIGPGQGALTKLIYCLVEEFRCFEKDETMRKYLGQFLQLEQIVWGDILTEEIEQGYQSTNNLCVVGNLPYYITSPIFRKFFTEAVSPMGGVFLIQKEVAEKIKTTASKKSYLRWLLNNRYDIQYLFTVPPSSFSPPPKVDSAVVSLQRRDVVILQNEEYEYMLVFLDLISPYKRKTLGKIQKMLAKRDVALEIPEQYLGCRLEELDREDIKHILSCKF